MLNKNLHLNEEVFLPDVEMKSTRDGFADALVELGAKNPNIVVLTADWGVPSKTDGFKKAFPKRFIEVGIAEQNMIGIASGLAMEGKIPVAVSLAIFSPGRNWEQIRLSVCFNNLNVKVVSTHAGLAHCNDGGMAQALEDLALTRVLPNMTVLCPIDYYQAKRATETLVNFVGPVYMRLGREETPVVTSEKTPFEIGGAQVLVEGNDLTIISTGSMGYEALIAAKELGGKHGVKAEVINVHTVKPLDQNVILASARKTGHIITLEDHQITGGLGGTVAELLGENVLAKMKRIGVRDTFGESGKYNELKDKYGLSAHHVVKAALNLLDRR